jgi:FtsZ-interacting cell division protein ZipA
MSELQIYLAILGAIVVLVIFAYNRLQERRYRKQAESAFHSVEQDPLMETHEAEPGNVRHVPHQRADFERMEPQFEEDINEYEGMSGLQEPHFEDEEVHVQAAPSIPEPELVAHQLEPAVSQAATRPKEEAVPVRAAESPRSADNQAAAKQHARVAPIPPCHPHEQAIEYRIYVKGEGILGGVFADVVNRSRTLGKQVRWAGFPARGQKWEEMRPWSDIHYREIVVSMQLADRNGSASEQDLTELCSMVRDAAQPHGLKVICEDFTSAIERAVALDKFCVDVDVLIGLNVVARGEENLPMQIVRREAEQTGMVLAPDGTYQLQDRRGEILYSLCNHESTPFSHDLEHFSTHGVTLLFDVPRVPDGLKLFDNMVALGRKLASEIGGLLVDDNLRPLTDTGIERIRQQLSHIYERMETKGIPAGGDLALRLFS